ncbi:MAG TPA: diacylglycerol kinase family protein [Polyangiaceae bacterium]|jgi:diacylglycerol kinase family enzyme|nr:diacylglycerol kinase family protein [Polyangiaceae bacterium]
MPGIGVVLNPKSRRNLRDPGAATRLARRLGDHGVLRTAGSVEELYRIAEDFRRVDIDVLAISGGDGTGHVTLTGFLNVYRGHTMPHVALLRGGTMNTVANSVGVRQGRPEGLLARLIHAYARRATAPLVGVERHVLEVSPADPRHGSASRAASKDTGYGFLFGTGVVCGFLAEYYRDGEPTPLVAAQTLARGIGSALVRGPTIRRMAAPFHGAVDLDDGTSWPERDYLAVAAGTIADIGLNFKPFYRFDARPDSFQVLGIHASPIAFVKELPRIHRSQPMRAGKTYDALARRFVVRNLAPGATGMKYMIDGDLHEAAGDLAVSLGPRVKLVVG